MSVPCVVPAPGRLSTTTGCLKDSDSFWPMRRAVRSVEAPGDCGTMIRIGRLGYCAAASAANSTMNAAVKARKAPTNRFGAFADIFFLLFFNRRLFDRDERVEPQCLVQ